MDGDPGPLRRTLELLADGCASGLHLGGQVAVWWRGSVIADFAFGELRPGQAMRRDHLMLWLSSGKPVAAVAIAQLWERGLLGLDEPVARHLPEFAAGGKERVTIRHLLTHTGGVRMLDVGWPERSWDEIVARVAAQRLEPRWVPGERAGYHLTSSWFILGELVRRLDGRDFSRYVREAIFAPLALDDCWIGMPEELYGQLAPRLAPMFDAGREGLAPLPWHEPRRVIACSPGGNAWGPIGQLARFYEALRRGGGLDGVRIVAPQTVEALAARHRVGLVDQTFRAQLDWGLGFIVNSAWHGEAESPYGYGPHAGRRAFGHSGARSSVGFCDPDRDLVVALALNGLPSDAVHRARAHALGAAIYEDLGLAPANERL